MSKVKQALKDLREDAKHHLDRHTDYLNERLDIIEEKLKEGKKGHKVIKIIRKIIKHDIKVNGNIDIPKYGKNEVISKKEYDLLKDVLL